MQSKLLPQAGTQQQPLEPKTKAQKKRGLGSLLQLGESFCLGLWLVLAPTCGLQFAAVPFYSVAVLDKVDSLLPCVSVLQ